VYNRQLRVDKEKSQLLLPLPPPPPPSKFSKRVKILRTVQLVAEPLQLSSS